jgi:phenylalanyl-tRNA synthetase beta chain
MKIPISWLRDYVAIDLPLGELAGRLTMAGAETTVIEVTGDRWQGVVIGQISAIDPHPNADRLRLATVNLGTEQPTVVCGAPNLHIGDKIAFARIGAELIDGQSGRIAVLKPARIRGVTSSGMVCSEKELGISDRHEGIMVLPADAPLGRPLAGFLGDTVLDLEVTPNRPDLLSVNGIAREVAALTGQPMSVAVVNYSETGPPIAEEIAVEIADPDLCPRYCASLISGIKIGDSPDWLKERLAACGMRPINNIVDATNYVMLEYGQPLHGFDHDKIRDKKIIVRRADEGEVLVSLDGVERSLNREMLVIADSRRAVAIAGVMGGANSEVSQDTTSILLESASFNPASIHFTSHGLGLTSEASTRFERAIRLELTLPALRRATQLILELAGGRAAKGVIDVHPGKVERKPIHLRTSRTNKILGMELTTSQIEATLSSLGLELQKAAADGEFQVTVPYWRSDISLEVDLIEEVARVVGYDAIPTTMLSSPMPRQDPAPILGLKREVRQGLAGFGFQEVITFSLTSRELLDKAATAHPLKPAPLHLANAMTADQEYLRTSLRGNLLSTLAANLRHEDGAIKLFELGRVYLSRDNDLPDEVELLCGLLVASGGEKSWNVSSEPIDFFTDKGVVESLLARLYIAGSFTESEDSGLRTGWQAAVIVNGDKIGVIGELHPTVAEAFEISRPVYLFEVSLAALLPHTVGGRPYQPITRFPAVVRDVALVVDSRISHQQVMDIIQGFALVGEVTLFDVYIGRQVPPGKKSLAYRISFQLKDHTLTDEQAEEVLQQILDRLASKLGASLRE